MNLKPIIALLFSVLITFSALAAPSATWPNFVVSPSGGGGIIQAVTNYFLVPGANISIITNTGGTNVTWTVSSSGSGALAGTVISTGASTAGAVPSYSGTDGTNVVPTEVIVGSLTNLTVPGALSVGGGAADSVFTNRAQFISGITLSNATVSRLLMSDTIHQATNVATTGLILGTGAAAGSGDVSALQTNVAAANPTATVATTAVNGSAPTFMRSDAAPAIPASFITANQTNPAAANPTGTAGLSAVNGSALTWMRSDGAPAIGQTIVPTWTGLHTFQSGAAITELLFGAAQVSRGTLTHAGGNVIVDFALTNRFWSCTITGAVTILPTNAVAGKWANVMLFNTQATNCTPTFAFLPASSTTNFFGGAPSTLTAGTVGWLTLAAIDSTTNSTKAWYTETQ